jgi:hypothetical protein
MAGRKRGNGWTSEFGSLRRGRGATECRNRKKNHDGAKGDWSGVHLVVSRPDPLAAKGHSNRSADWGRQPGAIRRTVEPRSGLSGETKQEVETHLKRFWNFSQLQIRSIALKGKKKTGSQEHKPAM